MVVYLVDNLLKGKLPENEFPFIDQSNTQKIPKTIIIYIIGGVTFAEAKHIRDIN